MTAVEWLISQYIKDGLFKEGVYEQAKEIEKQQIIDAFGVGCHHESKRLVGYQDVADQYYNETYGSKGSDDYKKIRFTEEEWSVLNNGTSQTEISDEEISKWADDYGFRVPYDGSNDFYDKKAINHFINGAKKYREQLKKKQ